MSREWRNVNDREGNYGDSPVERGGKKRCGENLSSPDLEGVGEVSEVVPRSITRVSREVRKNLVGHQRKGRKNRSRPMKRRTESEEGEGARGGEDRRKDKERETGFSSSERKTVPRRRKRKTWRYLR